MDTPSRSTILVAGAGRSGTSWLGKILDASPQVFYKHEPDNYAVLPWFRGIPSRLDSSDENDRYEAAWAAAIENTFWHHSTHFHRPPTFRKDFLRMPAWNVLTTTLRLAKKATAKTVSMRIPRWVFSRDPRDVCLVIKSVVSNMRLSWVHAKFPGIRTVLIVRHPGGYLSSWLRGARTQGWSGFGARERLEGVVFPLRAEHRQYEGAFKNGTDFERELIYWIVTNETPLLDLKNPEALKVVVYEELCRDPAGITDEVLRFARLPFCRQVEKFIHESTGEHREGYHEVHKDSRVVADRWREELDRESVATIERYLARSSLGSYW